MVIFLSWNCLVQLYFLEVNGRGEVWRLFLLCLVGVFWFEKGTCCLRVKTKTDKDAYL